MIEGLGNRSGPKFVTVPANAAVSFGVISFASAVMQSRIYRHMNDR
ncbi:hypothetical protein MnTg02_01289 [bacterium MnTg02]|nr:hypothetical protein MnTg02_01289 [bacterium MnTg02]